MKNFLFHFCLFQLFPHYNYSTPFILTPEKGDIVCTLSQRVLLSQLPVDLQSLIYMRGLVEKSTFFLYENQFNSVYIFHTIKFLCYKDNENFSFSAKNLGFSSIFMFFYEFWQSNHLEILSKSTKTVVTLSR